ncbi:MAG TPA: aminopeptidase P family N-terminal domain-containing protein, partial [Ilumatobacteraceae bacterium]
MPTATRRARLAHVPLPDFGMAATEPLLPASIYHERLQRLRARMERRGYDHVVVWGDREHSANIAYLTGFDPRFEEAVLVVAPVGDPAILLGNECYGLADVAPLPMRAVRFQDLSLSGQPRDRSRPLPEILGDQGIVRSGRVGVVGWKVYASRETIEV